MRKWYLLTYLKSVHEEHPVKLHSLTMTYAFTFTCIKSQVSGSDPEEFDGILVPPTPTFFYLKFHFFGQISNTVFTLNIHTSNNLPYTSKLNNLEFI